MAVPMAWRSSAHFWVRPPPHERVSLEWAVRRVYPRFMSETATTEARDTGPERGMIWRVRIVVLVIFAIAVVVVSVTNNLLTERFTESTRSRSEVRLALYSGSIISELQRNSVVPLLLARDPTLASALDSRDFSRTSQHLISFREDLGAAELLLLDLDGRTVAATDRNIIGSNHRASAYFVEALRASETVFSTTERDAQAFDFVYSRAILSDREIVLFQRESAELRLLNARLQREIAEREKVQKDLEVAEQTLAQSSKLAALGEMSAAVSHELNQPLAAMKTYLAGARLLLQRRAPKRRCRPSSGSTT
jgi:C4-dicarboxylate-specific signal transduction histidine kinase